MAIRHVQIRKWHRDIGYFFVGLIISFAISGIAQNHRGSWNPEQYAYASKNLATQFHLFEKEKINDDTIKKILVQQGIQNHYFGFRIEDDKKEMRIFLDKALLTVDMNNGKGVLEFFKTRPLIGQMSILHRENGSSLWILYSDIFAAGLLTIAITGMFMVKGKHSFRKRGFMLTLAGIIIPILLLIFVL